MELEFATTQEIIDELMSRGGFKGLIVRQCEEIRNVPAPSDSNRFELHMRGISPQEVGMICQKMSMLGQHLDSDWKDDTEFCDGQCDTYDNDYDEYDDYYDNYDGFDEKDY